MHEFVLWKKRNKATWLTEHFVISKLLYKYQLVAKINPSFAVDVKLKKLNEELGTETCEQLIKRLNDLKILNVVQNNFDWYAAELKEEIAKKREVREECCLF